jgi:hypothetical protein
MTSSTVYVPSASGSVDSESCCPQPGQVSHSSSSSAVASSLSPSVHSGSPGAGHARPRNSDGGTDQARAASSSARYSGS